MSNEKFGKYEIRGTLGEGAMGRVLDAFDSVIERRAALKVVRCPAAGDADGTEAMARFRREAQAAGRLNHPNIVAVYDYGEDDRHAWIAMEHVPGGSLKEMLERDERLAMPAILKIMEQMLSALDYSHKRGVVHRDIKPANIMLGAEGEVKIADFGIARIENSSMTQVGTIMGTPSYMAPEQLRGETVDSRADIWAAGVVLYQLVTGEKPFSGGYSSVQHKAINTEPTPPSTLSVTAPLGIDAVVARAMAKRPDGRFATAGEFAKALQGAMAAPTAALPVADGDATIVATASGTKPAAPAKSPVPARKGAPLVLIGGGVTLLAAAGAALFFLGGQPTQPMAIPPRDVAVNTPARSNPPSSAITRNAPTAAPPQHRRRNLTRGPLSRCWHRRPAGLQPNHLKRRPSSFHPPFPCLTSQPRPPHSPLRRFVACSTPPRCPIAWLWMACSAMLIMMRCDAYWRRETSPPMPRVCRCRVSMAPTARRWRRCGRCWRALANRRVSRWSAPCRCWQSNCCGWTSPCRNGPLSSTLPISCNPVRWPICFPPLPIRPAARCGWGNHALASLAGRSASPSVQISWWPWSAKALSSAPPGPRSRHNPATSLR